MEKSGLPAVAALTVRTTAALWVMAPLAPLLAAVMLKGNCPTGVDESAAIVKVLEPLPGTSAGLKFVVAPAGKPDTVKATLPEKPLIGEIAI